MVKLTNFPYSQKIHFCSPKLNMPFGQSKHDFEKFAVNGVDLGQVVKLKLDEI